MRDLFRPDRGVRRVVLALLAVSAALIAAGFLLDLIWLFVTGAWVLIAAGSLEMIYRP
ncbi:hypothetical protein V1L54_23225 [Streptomyces sp. TRM 70361]|uniref:hypothetical protein n=1 Tax=Streptomyces sp. TRM 70361 TaxID=3116553 RepID=UPI002E7B99EA|nr:hypothetical protein [Streptomyces sp. TRM 70361]MEE1942277.1 hypothetical protein [Streptomyces sp. TRM 70361]